MFIKKSATSNTSSKFNLKNIAVDLIPGDTLALPATVGLQELEAMRTTRRAQPASKHGLEIICGGSCETGAQ